MKLLDTQEVYHILENLTNLEIAYMEYSRRPRDFVEYQTYVEYFDNSVIKAREWYRFYSFNRLNTANERKPLKYVTDISSVTDAMIIMPNYDFSVTKLFNFPNPLRHRCNYYTLVCQMDGEGKLTLDDSTHKLKAGDFFLVPPEVYYSIETSLDSICICMNLRRSFVAAQYKSIFGSNPQIEKFLKESLNADDGCAYLALRTGGENKIRELVLSVMAEYIRQDEFSNNAMKSYLALMFTTILRDTATVIESSAKITRLDGHYQQILNYLEVHYQTANLTDLSDTIHFSKQYICKIVREKTGDTFNTLLINTKLSIAEQYLMTTDLNLENIAYLCGFSAASHLSRVFKEHYGVSPSEYRKQV